jgi:flagellar hook-associated protein 3 FlgL
MRITNQMTLQRVLRDVNAMRESLAAIQQDLSTQKNIQRVSDDPVAAVKVMQLEHRLRGTEQYRHNAVTALTRLAVEDEVIETARDLVGRVTGLALSITSDLPSDPGRQTALAEVSLILDTIVALGNTQVGNEYIFGGGETTTPPFQAGGTYVGGGLVRQIEIDDGLLAETNHTGDQLLGVTTQALRDVIQELQTGTQASIQTAVAGLDSANQDLLMTQAELGARQHQVDTADRHLATRETSMLVEREEIQRVDSAESRLKIMSAQQAIEQAYASIARVLDTSLVDFL